MFLYLLTSVLVYLSLPQNTQTAETSFRMTVMPQRDGYRYMPGANLYYKEHVAVKNWSEAVATCGAEGAQLATPFTKAEVLAITILFTCKTQCSWVGLHDSGTEGTFVSSNGTLVSNTRWLVGERNDGGRKENCVCVLKSGVYTDLPCARLNPFMCSKHRHEMEAFDLGETDKAADPLQGYRYMQEHKWHYKVHRVPMSWLDAAATCQAEGAQLAAPTTQQEARTIASLLDLIVSYYAWIGLHDSLAEGHFVSMEGTPAAQMYTGWLPGEPNDAGECEDCVVITKSGSYVDGPCSWNNMFICIKRQAPTIAVVEEAGPPSLATAGANGTY